MSVSKPSIASATCPSPSFWSAALLSKASTRYGAASIPRQSEYPALRSTMVEILERLATLELKELLSSEPEHTERF
jgi:hypothetical protein